MHNVLFSAFPDGGEGGGGVNKRKEEYLLNIDLYCYHFEIIT